MTERGGRRSWGKLGVCFALSLGGVCFARGAEAQSSTEASRPAGAARAPVLASRAGRSAVDVRREGTELVLTSCLARCRGDEAAQARVTVPPQLAEGAMSSRSWALPGGETLLQLSLTPAGEAAGRAYSVLVRAGRDDEAPRVLLKGYLDEASGVSLEFLGEGAARQLVLTKRRAAGPCGRPAFAEVRRFDAERGEFVPARRPPFAEAARAGAATLRAEPIADVLPPDTLEVLPALEPFESGVARAADGSLETALREPWATLGLALPAGTVALRFTLQDETPSASKPARLWLEREDGLTRVDLPARAGHFELPLALPGARCVVLVDDAEPVAIAEVRAIVGYPGDPSTPALLRALESGEAGELAVLALAARGEQGAQAVAAAYPGLSPVARRRARELAERLPDAYRGAVELAALVHGDAAQRARAEEHLLARGEGVVPTLLAELARAAPAAELPWLRLLARLSPDRVVAETLPRLERRSARARSELRAFVGELTTAPQHRSALRAALVTMQSRRVRVELLRALSPRLADYEPEASESFVALGEAPSFAEQYVLVDAALSLRERPGPRAKLRGLLEQPPTAWSPVERDAYRAHLLELWAERITAGDVEFAARVDAVARTGGVRVRKAAAGWLGRVAAPSATLPQLARGDAWPLVREEALRALGERAPREPSAATTERVVIEALRSDESALARRSAARALRRFSGEEGLAALRDALDEDVAWTVRAEAATALGRRCDRASLERLTELAHGLAAPQAEGEVERGLAALGALVELRPDDLETRLAPLRLESLPGALRGQIERTIADASSRGCRAP